MDSFLYYLSIAVIVIVILDLVLESHADSGMTGSNDDDSDQLSDNDYTTYDNPHAGAYIDDNGDEHEAYRFKYYDTYAGKYHYYYHDSDGNVHFVNQDDVN